MAKILVVGGFGFYGSKVAETLAARGHAVARGSRRRTGRPDEVLVDLARPDSFAAFADYDAIVNCSDSVNAAPDAGIRHVLAHGGTWLEMGAQLEAVERLLQIEVAEPRGTAIIGVGVFPGSSTALARAVAEAGPSCETIELGIRLSPLSGAGRANCALMAESLFVPASRYEGGQLVQDRAALGQRAQLSFEGQTAVALNVALPDTALVHRAVAAPNVRVYFALVPGWLRFNFAMLAWMCALLRFAKRPLVWLLTWQMVLLRAYLLRGVESRLQIVAIADRGTPNERSRELSFADGQQATAECTAAAVDAWLRREPGERPTGVFGVAELVTLDELLAALPER